MQVSRIMKDDFSENMLIDYLAWKKCNDFFTMYEYIPLKFSLEQVLICSTLFCPRIDRVGNFLFLKDSRQLESIKTMIDNNCNSKSIESFVNHVFLSGIFPIDAEDKEQENLEKAQLKILGKRIEYSWNLYFKDKFPDKKIKVEFYKDKYDEYCITFYQDIDDFQYDKEELEEYFFKCKS